jgi:uncharacterized protein YidB (DUF937 family)
MTILSKILALAGGAVGGPLGYKLVDNVVDFLQDDRHGGITGLVQSFQSSGLGNVVSSWIGVGPNLPVSSGQVETALGKNRLQQMAENVGISVPEVASGLARILPQLIDRITPDGKLPANPAQAVKALANQN